MRSGVILMLVLIRLSTGMILNEEKSKTTGVLTLSVNVVSALEDLRFDRKVLRWYAATVERGYKRNPVHPLLRLVHVSVLQLAIASASPLFHTVRLGELHDQVPYSLRTTFSSFCCASDECR